MVRTRATKRKLHTVILATDDDQTVHCTFREADANEQLYPTVPWVPSQPDHVLRNAAQRSSVALAASSGTNKGTNADKKAKAWASLLPDLLVAYQQGYGAGDPLPQALQPITDQLLCTCEHQTKDVVCIFKCGKYECLILV